MARLLLLSIEYLSHGLATSEVHVFACVFSNQDILDSIHAGRLRCIKHFMLPYHTCHLLVQNLGSQFTTATTATTTVTVSRS